MLQNRSVPDVRDKRKEWKKHMPESDVNSLVFLDESGVNTNMTRHYTRSKINERVMQYHNPVIHTAEREDIPYHLSGRDNNGAFCGIFDKHLNTRLIGKGH